MDTWIGSDICIELCSHHFHKVGIYIFSLNFELAAGILSVLIIYSFSKC